MTITSLFVLPFIGPCMFYCRNAEYKMLKFHQDSHTKLIQLYHEVDIEKPCLKVAHDMLFTVNESRQPVWNMYIPASWGQGCWVSRFYIISNTSHPDPRKQGIIAIPVRGIFTFLHNTSNHKVKLLT